MNYKQQLNLALYKMYAELKAESSRSYLGVLWWLIEPVLYLGAFYILLVLIMGRDGPNFIPNFLCGIVVWKWFDSGVKSGGNALIQNSALLQRVNVPKYIFSLSAVFGSVFRFLPVLACLIIFLIIYGLEISAIWLWVIAILITQFLLILALAFFLSSFMSFIPDLKVAVDNGMMFLFFLSGVLFDVNNAPDTIKQFLVLNPMLSLIEMYRNVLIHKIAPDLKVMLVIGLVSAVIIVASLFLMKRLSQSYAKVRF